MIFATALTFLLVGYLMGVAQGRPDLPQESAKRIKKILRPERVGPVERPSAEALAKQENPLLKETEEAMKETLDGLL